MARVCSEWREAVEDSSHYATWRALSGLKETSLVCDLVTALRLSPAKIKQGEYTRKRRRGGGFYNIVFALLRRPTVSRQRRVHWA